MPPHNDDDDSLDDFFLQQYAEDEGQTSPHEPATVRCQNCKKFILEDIARCPYCKHLQLEAHHQKPLWFIITVIVCILLIGGYLLFGVFDILSRFHR